MTLAAIIQDNLENGHNFYFAAYCKDGERIQIRMSDHRMNDRNNYGKGCKVLSFVSGTDRNSDNPMSANEWVCEGEYASEAETIQDILDEFEVEIFFDQYNNCYNLDGSECPFAKKTDLMALQAI